MNTQPMNFSRFWLHKVCVKSSNGIIFSSQPGQCVGENESFCTPWSEQSHALNSLTLKIFLGEILFFPTNTPVIPGHLTTCHHFPFIPSRATQTPWKTIQSTGLAGAGAPPGWEQRGTNREWFSEIFTAPRPWGGVNPHLGNVRSTQRSPNGLFDFQQRGSGRCVAGWVRNYSLVPGGDKGTHSDLIFGMLCLASPGRRSLAGTGIRMSETPSPCSLDVLVAAKKKVLPLLNRQFLLSHFPHNSKIESHSMHRYLHTLTEMYKQGVVNTL